MGSHNAPYQHHRTPFIAVLLGAILLAWWFSTVPVAKAVSAAPGWELFGYAEPTNLSPGGEGTIKIYAMNLGGAEVGPGAVLTDTLPAGLKATGGEYISANTGTGGGGLAECSGETVVTCNLQATEYGGIGELTRNIELITIPVAVAPNASGSAIDHVTVTGGGSLGSAGESIPVTYSPSTPNVGIANFDAWITNEDGTTDTQAGSHPYDLTVAFALNNITVGTERNRTIGSPNEQPAGGEVRGLNVNLPPGIVGNPQAVPRCTRAQFDRHSEENVDIPHCPLASQIGINLATLKGSNLAARAPVYNLVPPPGVAAEFGFTQAGVQIFIDSGVRTGGDNGITTHVNNIPEREITFNLTTIWGTPADPIHDLQRSGDLATGQECDANFGNGCPAGVAAKPLLSLPTSCGEPPEFSIEEIGTWTDEHYVAPPFKTVMHDSEDDPTGITGCERLQPFTPAISIAPDTNYADTPAGLSVDVSMPQGLNPEGFAAPGLKDTTVVLPEGLAINPGQATGLQACQPSQEALGVLPDGEVNEGPVSCPAASKVGTDEVSTPLLPNKLKGNVYILGQNPPNLQLLVTASGEGVNLKLVGTVHLDENTGQLTTTFQNTPDVPFTDFKLNFSGGAQAALATSTRCGTYGSRADFTPWPSPFIEDQLDTSRFQIDGGPNGTPCVSPMPFTPSMIAGATTDQAGGYTDFTMLLQRGDEQQRIKTLSFKTPEGLLGMIAKVPLCQEPQAAQGTCTSASQIGHTVVGAGPGPYPFYIPQASAPPAPIYLTGSYKGAPFGLSIVVPLIAGPFNLGTEVVRAKLEVDPLTSQVTITTDPLPQIEKGIPADLRLINAVIDRPGFMFNPTSCAPMSFSGTATSTEGATAALGSHFQMGSCQALKFKPDFKVSTSGKNSRRNGASLDVKLIYPTGNLGANQASSQSNIQKVKVDLPKQLPSRLTTLQKACTSQTFEANPAACPTESRVGTVTAITPVLPVPLTGPAVFVSYGGEKFPELVFILQGYGVTVYVHAETFISKAGITSSTLRKVPDVPIASFELKLPQGPYSALAANGNLCKSKLVMPTAFTAQNEAVIHQNTPITVTGCPKTVKHKAKRASGKARDKTHKSKKK